MTLTRKEKIVLGEVVRQFILTGMPVSSSSIAQKSNSGMSPATIRAVLADLEKKDYVYQPHTSSGRVPKTRAYRAYVDNMMKKSRLSSDEKDKIGISIRKAANEFDDILKEVTRILAHLSHQLGVIVSPHMEQGIFQQMEMRSVRKRNFDTSQSARIVTETGPTHLEEVHSRNV